MTKRCRLNPHSGEGEVEGFSSGADVDRRRFGSRDCADHATIGRISGVDRKVGREPPASHIYEPVLSEYQDYGWYISV